MTCPWLKRWSRTWWARQLTKRWVCAISCSLSMSNRRVKITTALCKVMFIAKWLPDLLSIALTCTMLARARRTAKTCWWATCRVWVRGKAQGYRRWAHPSFSRPTSHHRWIIRPVLALQTSIWHPCSRWLKSRRRGKMIQRSYQMRRLSLKTTRNTSMRDAVPLTVTTRWSIWLQRKTKEEKLSRNNKLQLPS